MAFERSRYSAFFGQSYAREGYQLGGSWAPFMNSLIKSIDSNPSQVQLHLGGSPTIAPTQIFQNLNAAYDGSAVLQAHAGSVGNYWIENDGTTAGPRLTQALTELSSVGLSYGSLVYSQGEQDAQYTTNSTIATSVRVGMQSIRQAVRAAVNPLSPNDIPWWVDILGPRFPQQEMNEYLLRDAMLDMIDNDAHTYRGVEKYALNPDNTIHPSEDNNGYARQGAWMGRKVARWLIDQVELRGPSISGVARSGNTLTVSISVPSGGTLVKPAHPDFMGMWDASGNKIPSVSMSWSGNNLMIDTATPVATFRYPARTNRPHDITNIIRLSNPTGALYPSEPGLPLESIKTVTL